MHTNFIPALYSSTLVIKLFKNITFIIFFYKLRNLHGMLTFKTEVLHLVSNVQLVKRLLL